MAEDTPGNGRVSVSEDKLYRALAEFELSLLEKLEKRLSPMQDEIGYLKQAHSRIKGALVLVAVIATVIGPTVAKVVIG